MKNENQIDATEFRIESNLIITNPRSKRFKNNTLFYLIFE
jgi:hypothetical protein